MDPETRAARDRLAAWLAEWDAGRSWVGYEPGAATLRREDLSAVLAALRAYNNREGAARRRADIR